MTVVMRHTTPAVVWPKLSDTGTSGALVPWIGQGPTGVVNNLGPGYTGSILENYTFDGGVALYGSNITLRNCYIYNFDVYGVIQNSPYINCRLEHCHINGGGWRTTTGISSAGGPLSHIIGCRLEGMTIGINSGGPQRIADNYIFNLWSGSSDPDHRHFDGIATWAIGGQVIENNALIVAGGTSCFFAKTADFSNIDNVMVRNNLMMGGTSYPVTIDVTDGYTITNLTLQENYIEYGNYGYITSDAEPPITEINNTKWNPTHEPVPVNVQAWLAKT